ncbi:MAG: TraR/DksA family transcriptional regulator [Acidimicrobiales bacterium]|jgi:RNA polymerase-binding protein DksA|nr:TraR/DksA family transcriptional regulator [Acidimicrobiales bacterium]
MDEQTTDTFRAALEEEQALLSEQLRSLLGEDFDANFADRAEVAAEQGEQQALAGVLRDQLAHVERALGRLDDGTYGQCEICGEAIAAARLEALPSTTVCITHA